MTQCSSRGPLACIALFASGVLAACADIPIAVHADPRNVTLLPGGHATLTVNAGPVCEDPESPCPDLDGRLLDYEVRNLPSGVTYSVDTTLRTPTLPGLARIRIDVAADAPVGLLHDLTVHPILDNHGVATAVVTLKIVGDQPAESLPDAVAVAAGKYFSLAVLADGTVASWGENDAGQLGLGDRRRREVPTRIAALHDIVAVAAGDEHALAVTGSGEVWTWGANADGQLGTGTGVSSNATPGPISGLRNIRAVAGGASHSLALDAAGAVWAWGTNRGGALGDGTTRDSRVPVSVQNLPPVRKIAAGYAASFAIDMDGALWTWGIEIARYTGFNTRPVQVGGVGAVTAIDASGRAVQVADADGRVWSWGFNSEGRLGNGSANDRELAPRLVDGPRNAVEVDIGESSALALIGDGTLWQWGEASHTPTSDGTTPAPLAEIDDVVSIAVHGPLLAALRCGQVWTWGFVVDERTSVVVGSAQPRHVVGIGDDSGCRTTTLRVTAVGGVRFLTAIDSDPSGLGGAHGEYRGTFDRGTTVTLRAETPSIGEFGRRAVFSRWGGDCSGSEPVTTVTLERSSHCLAIYDETTEPLRRLQVISDGGRVTSDGVGAYGPAAIACGRVCELLVAEGAVATLMATPSTGFEFRAWEQGCTGSQTETTVRLNENVTCLARYRPFELEASVTGAGRVISEPAGIDCGATCSTTPRVGSVTLMAQPDLGWRLARWEGDCSGTAPDVAVAMVNDRRCVAVFERIPATFLLTVTVEGQGRVSSGQAGIDCPGTCVASFPALTSVALVAAADPGWQLTFWLDDCLGVGLPVRSIVMDRDIHCRVQFTGQTPHPIARIVASNFGTARPGDILTLNGLQSHVVDPVTGAQDPAAIRSMAWDLDDDGAFDDAIGSRGTAGVTQVAFQTAGIHRVRLRVVGGPFDLADINEISLAIVDEPGPLFPLTVMKAGAGTGSIVTAPLGLIACDETCAGVGPLLFRPTASATMTLVAQPAPGSGFAGWSGTGCTAPTPDIQVSMTEARTCIATFATTAFMLTVNTGAGGTVTSTPAGIACGVDCGEPFASGSSVVLTAAPDAGFAVDTWSGCDVVNGNQCTVSMVGERTVSVTFVPLAGPFTLTVIPSGPAGSLGRVLALAPPGAIHCGVSVGTTCVATLPAGTTVVLRPDDWAIENNRFGGWTGCDSVGALFACTVTLTSDRTLTATFTP